LFNVPREVGERKEDGSIVQVGAGGAKGTKAVVVRERLRLSGRSTGGKRLIELEEEDVKNEASEDDAKRTALGKAFVLRERGKGTIRGEVVTSVRCSVEKVEKGEKGGKLGKVGEHGPAGVAGNSIKHVDDVKEEKGAVRYGLGRGRVHETFKISIEAVYNVVNATRDGNSKLALG
jgi:hypothetical protein